MIYKGKYKNYLKSKEWKIKREFVLNRDGCKCLKCNSVHNLNAHHLYYVNKRPDLTPTSHIVTLCNSCHEIEHKKYDFKDFLIKSKSKKKNNRKRGVKKAPKKWAMSKRDKELQKRYDKHNSIKIK